MNNQNHCDDYPPFPPLPPLARGAAWANSNNASSEFSRRAARGESATHQRRAATAWKTFVESRNAHTAALANRQAAAVFLEASCGLVVYKNELWRPMLVDGGDFGDAFGDDKNKTEKKKEKKSSSTPSRHRRAVYFEGPLEHLDAIRSCAAAARKKRKDDDSALEKSWTWRKLELPREKKSIFPPGTGPGPGPNTHLYLKDFGGPPRYPKMEMPSHHENAIRVE